MSDGPDSLSSAKNEALKWVAEGMKLEEAAARVGVGVLTVKRWARENDIPTSQADIFRNSRLPPRACSMRSCGLL